MSKFPSGALVVTAGISYAMDEYDNAIDFRKFVNSSIMRHLRGDWGDMSVVDKSLNDSALADRTRLFSAYEHPVFQKIWIITEADRSATTVLFPSEY